MSNWNRRYSIVSSCIFLWGSFSFAGQKVVVIGAGLGGLVSAYELQKMGYDVRLFEKGQRPGGRVFTVNIRGTPVEIGGEDFSDGGDVESVHPLIQELGLNFKELQAPFSLSYVDSHGRVLNWFDLFGQAEAKGLPIFTEEAIEKRIESVLKAIQARQSRDNIKGNMREFLEKFFEDHTDLRDFFDARMKTFEGKETEDLDFSYAKGSFKELLELYLERFHKVKAGDQVASSSVSIEGGNGRLPLALAKRIKEMGGQIEYQASPRIIHDRNNEKKYELQIEKGGTGSKPTHEIVEADIVVLAIPSSAYGDLTVDGKIKHAVEQAKVLEYSPIAKALVPLKWATPPSGYIQSNHSFGWLSSDNSVATLYYSGKDAAVSEPDLKASIQRDFENLERIYQATSQVLANDLTYPGDTQFYSCPNGAIKNWTDSYARGGYSTRTPKTAELLDATTETCGVKVLQAFQPLNGETFYFVGEHTSKDARGSMLGAMLSGMDAAKMIKNCHGSGSK